MKRSSLDLGQEGAVQIPVLEDSPPEVSVIVPCFNERPSVVKVLERVQAACRGFRRAEVIVVDDGSMDGTPLCLRERPELYRLLIEHPGNFGKGRAIATALPHLRSSIVIIQDADGEYSPEDYPVLLEPLFRGGANVVYGRRRKTASPGPRPHSFEVASQFFSWLTRRLTSLPVHDIATGYKAFSTELLRSLNSRESGFSWDAEVTMKLADQAGVRYEEVEISYTPRGARDGKKLHWWHGFRYLWVILRHGVPGWLRRLGGWRR